MFGKLASLMYRRRWYVIGAWLVILAMAGSQAAQVGKVLGPGDFSIKGSDSAQAAQLLNRQFHRNDSNTSLVVVHNPHATVSSTAFRQQLASLAARIKADRSLRVTLIENPLISNNAQLISRDRHSVALLVASSLSEEQLEEQIDPLRSLVRTPGLETHVTGTAAENHDVKIAQKEDLNRGESITVPILIVILLLVFGAVVAAGLPLMLAASSSILSLALVYLFGHIIDTSVYVTNVVTTLGLGIAIDYSLFIVYRFREELKATGNDVERSVVRTMETTGRSVFFAGLTVAIGLSSLILTNVSFMQSMGLGGVLVPVTSLAVAMTLLPAVLGTLGPRVDRLRVLPRRFTRTEGNGVFHRLATEIMRRPLLTGGTVLLVLLALTAPVTRLALGYGSLKNANQTQDSIAGLIFMQQHFPSAPNPVQVVIQHTGPGNLAQASALRSIGLLERTLAKDGEAAQVIGPADALARGGTLPNSKRQQMVGQYLSADKRTALITIVPKEDVGSPGTEALVRHTRATAAVLTSGALAGSVIHVGGQQAQYTDFKDALYDKFPFIVATVLILSYGFLFYAFRSVFLPLKAVLLNLLSVGASYGMLQLVFQQGAGSRVLGFSAESGIASWVPVFLFAFLFGLSMDYEVFLLSRIRESWLATGNNAESVATGLEKTGRLITSAAAIMVVAFSGFLLGHDIQLKEFGFGLMASIALDATLIRVVLVPSIMELMGDWNWWVPRFLDGFARRTSFAEGDVTAPDESYEPVTA